MGRKAGEILSKRALGDVANRGDCEASRREKDKMAKALGQYMTPESIVRMTLDGIGFSGSKVLSKTIMEPSFGNGAFLVEIAERIIREGKKEGMNPEEISMILNDHIYGFEIDSSLREETVKRLNTLLAVHYIPSEACLWEHLYTEDALSGYKRFPSFFDYVAGNPPFVRSCDMSKEVREAVKNIKFSEGITNLYAAFYEMGMEMLNETGKLGFISPNSFMKNTSQRKFRDYLIDNRYLKAIFDFKNARIFEGVDTYTCVCVLDRDQNRTDFSVLYREYSEDKRILRENRLSCEYLKQEMKGVAWNLSSEADTRFLEENRRLPVHIKDIAVAQNGIATNRDSVYIHDVFEDEKRGVPYYGNHTDNEKIAKDIAPFGCPVGTVYFYEDGKSIPIESQILRRCVKASRFDGKIRNSYIIFPYKPSGTKRMYHSSDGKEMESDLKPLKEEELEKDFPMAYSYLLSQWDALTSRDMEKGVPWYAFARSQGLRNSCLKKIVFKHIINRNNSVIHPYIVDEDIIVYSGIYTTINTDLCISPEEKGERRSRDQYLFNDERYERKLTEIRDVFASEDFARYCSLVGKDMVGGYVEVSARNIKEFGINF